VGCCRVGSLLTFDIPQTALVATLDTYDFIIRTYAEEENIPMPENLPFSTRTSAVLVLDVPWRQHFFFSRKPNFFVSQL
jgi:hypothetical protein